MDFKGRNKNVLIRVVETGDVFETRTSCANYLGVNVAAVSRCLNGGIDSIDGLHLRYEDGIVERPLDVELEDRLCEMTGYICEWRDHPYYPNIYVSELGDVAKNFRGEVSILKQYMQNSGYLIVSVYTKSVDGNGKNLELVHRLVAETFLEKPCGCDFVNHLDGCKTNNCVENLEWCTRSENMTHAFMEGLKPTERVRIIETGEIFSSAADCARRIGGTPSGIHDCKTGRQRKHRGYTFDFLDDVNE